MKNYLVYQAYGSIDILHECIYSVLSFYKYNSDSDIHIIIYTDSRPYLQSYLGQAISYQDIEQSQIDFWKGEIDFIHRVKIKILQDFISRYEGNLLYTDTDTIFRSDISNIYKNIADDKLYMHQNEGRIGHEDNTMMRKVNRFFKSNVITERIDISPAAITNLSMYNAGVLGFHTDQKHILSKSLIFTDEIYPMFPRHIVEQLAFSLYMQTSGPLHEAREQIFHYWNFKEFRIILKDFFEKYNNMPIESLIERIENINPQRLIKPKLAYEQTRGMQRIYQKIIKGKWQMPAYEL
ncbi:hypothetical protein [Candidatus Entotheonella palauensis]|uniref:hypothetical protein n=1 Tax=Candidatus Entotheonella palauensis TaxID=93172 RepID=UPI000B7E9E05|nr:hypothetical protein [Candidatus Entotheonella palauensis]